MHQQFESFLEIIEKHLSDFGNTFQKVKWTKSKVCSLTRNFMVITRTLCKRMKQIIRTPVNLNHSHVVVCTRPVCFPRVFMLHFCLVVAYSCNYRTRTTISPFLAAPPPMFSSEKTFSCGNLWANKFFFELKQCLMVARVRY